MEWETLESALNRLALYAETLVTDPEDPSNWPEITGGSDQPTRYRTLYADVVALPGELVPCTLHPRQLMPNSNFKDDPPHKIGDIVLMWTWTIGKQFPENTGVLARIVALGVLDPPRPRLALVRSLRRVSVEYPFLENTSSLKTTFQVQRAIQSFWEEYSSGKSKFTLVGRLADVRLRVTTQKSDRLGYKSTAKRLVDKVSSTHVFFESNLQRRPTKFVRDLEDCMKHVDAEDVAWAKYALDARDRLAGLNLLTTLDRTYAWMKRGVDEKFNFHTLTFSASIHCASCNTMIFDGNSEMRMKGGTFSCATFVNLQGMTVHLHCWERRPGATGGRRPRMLCRQPNEYVAEFSWFPSFGWNPTLCVECHSLLGWAYRHGSRPPGSEPDFWGLIAAAITSDASVAYASPTTSYRSTSTMEASAFD